MERFCISIALGLVLFCACRPSSDNNETNLTIDEEPPIEAFRKKEPVSPTPKINTEADMTSTAITEKTSNKEIVHSSSSQTNPEKKKSAKRVIPQKRSVIVFDSIVYHLPDMYEGDKIDLKFGFANEGEGPLSIKEVDVECGCTTPSVPFLDILPGKKGSIGVQYNSVGKSGIQEPIIKVISNGIPKLTTLKLKVNVLDRKEEPKEKEEIEKDSLPN